MFREGVYAIAVDGRLPVPYGWRRRTPSPEVRWEPRGTLIAAHRLCVGRVGEREHHRNPFKIVYSSPEGKRSRAVEAARFEPKCALRLSSFSEGLKADMPAP